MTSFSEHKPVKNDRDDFQPAGRSANSTNEPHEPSVWVFVLPLVTFLVMASRYPVLQPESIDDVAVCNYFYLVIAQVIVCGGLVTYSLPKVLRAFPFKVDLWGPVVGVVGVVLWIGICWLNIERTVLGAVGLENWIPERVGFNPFAQMTDPIQRTIFLCFRFLLLAAVVPIIEELFLRGWFIRYIQNPDWQTVKLTDIRAVGLLAATVYGILTHPGEAIAAAAWFSLVTWLMVSTGKLWNCIVAHAITNLLLGVYVIATGSWPLW
jgi:CAAX prenyl protease-like protein